jgi:CRP/FNR family transcriptional regulator, cyclic AMP receptor protein
MTHRTEIAYGSSRLPFISPLQLLNGMSQQALHDFNAMVRTTRRRRGEWIFVLGDTADTIYLLREGRIKMIAFAEGGHEVLHEILGPGEIFGDTSTILGIPRTTSAQALETCLVCEIYRKDLETLLSMYPELSIQLLKSMGLRLKKAEAHLVNVVCNDVSHRVREVLIDLMIKDSGAIPDWPIKIAITQQDLANLIGASRQKTWQILKELEDAGVLRLMYRSILVIVPNKLLNGHIAYPNGAEHAVAKAKAAGR